MVEDPKRYNYMENVINEINGTFISLNTKDVKRNNQILKMLIENITDKMKEQDQLFKKLFRRVFYGGSFYDGLRVGAPDEFDLDLLLDLPKYAEPVITQSDVPGFVQLKLHKFDDFMKQPEAHLYKNFEKLFDNDHCLDTKKALAWMEGVLTKTLNICPKEGNQYKIQHASTVFKITVVKGGPALTLKLTGPSGMAIDIDLVTCFVFGKDKWPAGFRKNPVQSKPEFFIVPKSPKGSNIGSAVRLWRLSFQEQERVLIDNKRTLKPTIKLLKKMRDTLDHKSISSYYIKTVLMWIAENKGPEFWNGTLSYSFMTILKEYQIFIENHKIPYYWNDKNNLIQGINARTADNISNKLKNIIKDVERNNTDPKVIAKYLLTNQEYKKYTSPDFQYTSNDLQQTGDAQCCIE